MNRVGRKLEYSLMALKHMSAKKQGELTSAKEVAESFHAPFDATARVLQLMAQKGFVKAEHGAHGGYLINRDLSELTLHDLIEVIQGPSPLAKCMGDEELCEMQASCNIISPISLLDKKLNEFYRGISLKELLMR
jgi:Rrf2 family protein